MPHPKKLKRTMEYFLIYHPETNSYFCNKSKNPKVSVRRQFHRAFNENRDDLDCEFYKDVRKYGVDAFLVRYSIEMPEFCECRAQAWRCAARRGVAWRTWSRGFSPGDSQR